MVMYCVEGLYGGSSLGTKADFYVGRGFEAEWLGSLAWDSAPYSLPEELKGAASGGLFRALVEHLVDVRKDGYPASEGWPWPWDSSYKTQYTYAFEDGVVWASCYGSSWWRAVLKEPDHTGLKKKAALLPDMSWAPKIDAQKGGRHADKIVFERP